MHRIVIVLFPLILVPWEVGVRFFLKLGLWEFVGPTLCVAGLSMLVSLTKIKRISVNDGGGNLVSAVREGDVSFLIILMILLLIFLFAWAAAYYFAQPANSSWSFLNLPVHASIGVVVYAVSCVVYYIREAADA